MPEAGRNDKEGLINFYQRMCNCQEEWGWSMEQLLAENVTKMVVLLDMEIPIHC